MAHFNAHKPTPDDALEEVRTEDFIHFFSRAPSYYDPQYENDDQDDTNDDSYTPDDHSWLRSKFHGRIKQPHDDGYIY